MPSILIADDEASIRTILARSLKNRGFEVALAEDGEQALELLREKNFDLAILDVRMPGMGALDILVHQSEFPSKPYLFVITAQDTMENAVEAMKRGAYDYLTKPFDLEEIGILVDRAMETRRLKDEVMVLRQETGLTRPSLVGKSRVMREIFKTIGKVANQNVTVLIQGESGTGKEMIAKAIHNQGSRAGKPFVAVNCTAIPASLLESELFGYKKGAFTGAISDKEGYFQRAAGGTLFLDEIGDMSPALQAKLLRVLQEKEIQPVGDSRTIPTDVRVIAATNQNLAERIKKGLFRDDLYFRLNVVPLSLPPLRERPEDIPALVEHFLSRFGKELGLGIKNVSREAFEHLQNLRWSGNVRELENLLKRAFLLSQGSMIEKNDLATQTTHVAPGLTADMKSFEEQINTIMPTLLDKMLPDGQVHEKLIGILERALITAGLRKAKGNQLKTADLLGINRNTLRKKITELKVDRRSRRE